jgi:hypothetical protein
MAQYVRIRRIRAKNTVNAKTVRIFKGVFETRKSTQNAENLAEMRLWNTRGLRVYRLCINHSRAVREIHSPFSREAKTLKSLRLRLASECSGIKFPVL